VEKVREKGQGTSRMMVRCHQIEPFVAAGLLLMPLPLPLFLVLFVFLHLISPHLIGSGYFSREFFSLANNC
jgi:hypothetical protein